MRLPAIEIPETTDDKARWWAYRIGTLPFEATVDAVAMIIAAAQAQALADARIGSGKQPTQEHADATRRSEAQ